MMNLLSPTEFSRLYILDDDELFIHTGFEIGFDFYKGKNKEIMGYVAVLRSVIDDLCLYVDHGCGGRFYVKKVRQVKDIEAGLIDYANIYDAKPLFLVDCDKYFDEIKNFYHVQ